ncbi:MAG: Ig-like domain-containing protein [Massilibacteroides sp.]|nr:Ig-like domain-containing protein [Massilibacteroides sp.]
MKPFLLLAAVVWLPVFISAQSPYIHKVYDFVPAPGQFTNALPQYNPGDTKEDMIRKVETAIANNAKEMISLGGFGGYVVFGFDHLVENISGKYDFKILGNAFYSTSNPNGEAKKEGGSCEPGIVMVSYDANDNGEPDDAWYELAGSEYNRSGTIKNYDITYHKPDENKTPAPDNTYTDGSSTPYLTDTTYIKWTDNHGGQGYISRNMFHTQSYYPQWIDASQMMFRGTRLTDNYVDESGKRKYYVGYAYHWGYTDNHPDNDDRSGFNIEWAVDENGNQVSLPGIHFIKVYTGVNQYNGWIGEVSTEITGAEDLHLTGNATDVPVFTKSVRLDKTTLNLKTDATARLTATVSPSNATNPKVSWNSSDPSVATIEDGTLTALKAGSTTIQAITNDGYYIASCLITVTSSGTGTIPVENITLGETSVTLKPGDVYTPTVVIHPENATNRTVHWSSSDTDVIEITVNGVIFAVAIGNAVLTATTEDGRHTATVNCEVTTDHPTAINEIESTKPWASYANGQLQTVHLEGFRCTLFNLNGKALQTFTVAGNEESRPLSLPSGFYILSAENGQEHIPFKLRITNQ